MSQVCVCVGGGTRTGVHPQTRTECTCESLARGSGPQSGCQSPMMSPERRQAEDGRAQAHQGPRQSRAARVRAKPAAAGDAGVQTAPSPADAALHPMTLNPADPVPRASAGPCCPPPPSVPHHHEDTPRSRTPRVASCWGGRRSQGGEASVSRQGFYRREWPGKAPRPRRGEAVLPGGCSPSPDEDSALARVSSQGALTRLSRALLLRTPLSLFSWTPCWRALESLVNAPTTPSRVWSPTQGHPHPCQHLPAGVHLPAGAGPSGRSGAGRPRPARSHSESSPRGSEAGPGTAISAPLQRGQRVSAGLSSPGTSSGLSATWLQTGHPGPALGHSRCRAAPHRTPAWGQESLSWGLEGQLQQRL